MRSANMKEFLRRLNSLFSLTKQERTVVIFLLVSLLVGNTVLLIKKRREKFAEDLIITTPQSDRLTLDELIEKSESLSRTGGEYLKIDINTATAEELELLPGIGPALAERIVEYRDRFGPFENPKDLMKIKGIGEVKYESLKDYIMIRSGEP